MKNKREKIYLNILWGLAELNWFRKNKYQKNLKLRFQQLEPNQLNQSPKLSSFDKHSFKQLPPANIA